MTNIGLVDPLGPRQILSGTSDTVLGGDTIIYWNSQTASAKTESIFGAGTVQSFKNVIIKDAAGTAGTYNITIIPTSGTIEGSGSFVMNSNFQSINLVSDGVSNWMVT
jgi:hypothetical protein